MPRHTSIAFRAPGSSSDSDGPNVIRFIVRGRSPAGKDRPLLLTYHECRHLPAAGGDIGETGGAEPRQKSGELPAKYVGRKIDEHISRRYVACFADRKQLAADSDPLLRHPSAIAFAER